MRKIRLLQEAVDPEIRAKWDWAYKFSDEDIYIITKTSKIANFAERQHLKFIAHITRLQNDEPQKIMCFTTSKKRYARTQWSKLARSTGIDESNLRRNMYDRNGFKSWLTEIYGKS